MDQGYEETRFRHAVDKNFHCPICMNVLREPVQCRRNEHHFCTPCIKRHLKQNFQSCPLCMEELTLETLRQPPRILADYLSSLKINCEYADRGCLELVELGIPKQHVANCSYSPVTCTNDGCLEVINKMDQEHHETQVCSFKKVKCEDCEEEMKYAKHNTHDCVMRKDIAEVKINWTQMKDQLSRSLEMQEEMTKQLKNINTEVKEIMKEMKGIKTEVNSLKQSLRDTCDANRHIHPEKGIVVGGFTDRNTLLESSERFCWFEREWVTLQPMREHRSGATAVDFENQIIVSGGKTGGNGTDSMEIMNMNYDTKQWVDFPAKFPFKCRGHRCVVYRNRLLLIGGYSNEGQASDGIYEVLLTPPYTFKLLTRMGQERCYHGAVLFKDKVLIVGGRRTLDIADCLDDVLLYDIKKIECTQMKPLLLALSSMATVSWEDNVIMEG